MTIDIINDYFDEEEYTFVGQRIQKDVHEDVYTVALLWQNKKNKKQRTI